MKWVLLILGILVFVAAVAAVLGAATPRDHHATRKARFGQRPEILYATVAGPPEWRSDVKAFGKLPDGKWWEQDSHGRKITYELLEDTPPARRVVRIAGRQLPFGGTWTIEIAPAPGGADVRIREDGEIYNVIFRFVARYFLGYTSTIENYLRDLGRKFGEQVTIEG
jgi:hypothetical protein